MFQVPLPAEVMWPWVMIQRPKPWRLPLDLGAGSFNFKNNRGELLGDNSGNSILTINGSAISVGKPGARIVSWYRQARLQFIRIVWPVSTEGQCFIPPDRILTLMTFQPLQTASLSTSSKTLPLTGSPAKDSDFPDTDFPCSDLQTCTQWLPEAIMRSNGDKKIRRCLCQRSQRKGLFRQGWKYYCGELYLIWVPFGWACKRTLLGRPPQNRSGALWPVCWRFLPLAMERRC